MGLCPDFVGHLCREVAHLHGVVERSLRHLRHLAQDGVVDIGQFNQGHAGCEAKHALDEIHQRVGEEQEQAADGDILQAGVVQRGNVDALRQVVAHGDEHSHEGHGGGHLEQLRALGHLAQGVDGGHADGQLQQQKFERAIQHQCCQHCRHHHADEGRARIHKQSDKQRHHRKGQHKDVAKLVLHHPISQ